MEERSKLTRLYVALGLASLAFTATACNTVKGLGRDIESVGKTGEEVIN